MRFNKTRLRPIFYKVTSFKPKRKARKRTTPKLKPLIDAELLQKIQEALPKTTIVSQTKFLEVGASLLLWAIEEIQKGRILCSVSSDKTEYHEVQLEDVPAPVNPDQIQFKVN